MKIIPISGPWASGDGAEDAQIDRTERAEEAIVVAFRKHTLLPLDDCLHALQATIPRLTRSPLHRCLQRHGIPRLPEIDGDRPSKKKFKTYPIGFVHVDIAEVRTGVFEGHERLTRSLIDAIGCQRAIAEQIGAAQSEDECPVVSLDPLAGISAHRRCVKRPPRARAAGPPSQHRRGLGIALRSVTVCGRTCYGDVPSGVRIHVAASMPLSAMAQEERFPVGCHRPLILL